MIEVIKQLVDALEWCYGGESVNTAEAIKVGKQAIAELEKHKCTYPNCSYPCPDLPDCMDAKKQEADELTVAYFSGFYEGKKSRPKRKWVGLTDEDKQIAFDDTQEGGGFWEFADAIEAKLKQKNGYAEEKNT